MGSIFFISDMHLFHKTCLNFKREDGIPMRPEFAPKDPEDSSEVSRCLKRMNETIIENCNKVIGPSDKLYNIGDVTFYTGQSFVDLYKKINTKQHRLLLGNHDDPVKLIPMNLFKKVGIWRVFREHDFTAAHIPINKESLKTTFQVVGHTHEKHVRNDDGSIDLHYINICVENWNYSPVSMDEITTIIKERKQKLGI